MFSYHLYISKYLDIKIRKNCEYRMIIHKVSGISAVLSHPVLLSERIDRFPYSVARKNDRSNFLEVRHRIGSFIISKHSHNCKLSFSRHSTATWLSLPVIRLRGSTDHEDPASRPALKFLRVPRKQTAHTSDIVNECTLSVPSILRSVKAHIEAARRKMSEEESIHVYSFTLNYLVLLLQRRSPRRFTIFLA